MFLELLLIALRSVPQLDVCRTARSFAEAEDAIRSESFDIALLDYFLPQGSGLELARLLREVAPETVRIMLTAHTEAFLPETAHEDTELFRKVIDKVGSLDVLRTEIEGIIRERDPDAGAPGVDPCAALTTREREIFRLVGEGHPNKMIAARLFISQRTVESHRKTISRKLGMSGSELVRASALYGQPLPVNPGGLPARPPGA